jgi:hypothetical protein
LYWHAANTNNTQHANTNNTQHANTNNTQHANTVSSIPHHEQDSNSQLS